MKQIFELPSCSSCFWINSNDCAVGLSEIEVTEEICRVPKHIYEDSLIENEELSKQILRETPFDVYYPRKCYEKIQQTRIESYAACNWYPDISIPTASSILVPIPSEESLLNSLFQYLPSYPFVRLCSMSPKDICNPIFTDPHLALKKLKESPRTFDFCGKHLFLREKKEYHWEARCFWSQDKLRAVSLTEENKEKEIIKFFEKYAHEIPYHSATVDIGETSSGIELIEFNSFGPDMNATAGNFSWQEDVWDLLFSPEPVFR